ncbi:MAG: class I SAM-dependent methyltransferase [Methylobacter tundripaludum]|jgi:SAM-dependent methyltransferase|uniref:Methyltransferase family protein n=1 Tax=Methylobacter tundripaludum TaxID=173365 RepID=A0A2S6H2A0_9GAMM|nr:methyltransferase domain-containing protein [Methylobacter tundripaludum]MCK9637755.1 class I SAM-dependent methyltransferase [Methylobacter tundripaludum]PPK71574.1 methyltransferase family protein [Methylobacter tundripaludum]
MQANEYELMRDVQGQHWWWLGRERLLRYMMDKYLVGDRRDYLVADVGSGFGANISLLSEYGTVYALETDSDCLAYISETEPEATPIRWQSPEPVDHKFDVMLLADVLEHIEDDHAAMQWVADHLKPGGLAFITVPAHMHLWSEMDEVVHHFRRYSKNALLDTVNSKLTIEKLSFYNAILYPVKILFVALTTALRMFFPAKTKKSYNDLPPSFINTIFKVIMYVEAWVIRCINLPFGVSLVMVVKKL